MSGDPRPHVTFLPDGSAPVPLFATSPQILDFKKTNIIPANLSRDDAFAKMQMLLHNLSGLGFDDNPAGRSGAYLDATSWDTGSRNVMKAKGTQGASSCGTFIHNVWWLLGARSKQIGAQFVPATIITLLIDHAKDHKAAFGVYSSSNVKLRTAAGESSSNSERFVPKIGDILYLYNTHTRSNHIFTILKIEKSKTEWKFFSIDGGQAGAKFQDNGNMGIMGVNRVLKVTKFEPDPDEPDNLEKGKFTFESMSESKIVKDSEGNDKNVKNAGIIFQKEKNKKKRPINTWIKFDELFKSFTSELTEVIRKQSLQPSNTLTKPEDNIPEPDGPEEEEGLIESLTTSFLLDDVIDGPLKNKDIFVSTNESNAESGQTDEEGRFEVSNLTSNFYDIKYSHRETEFKKRIFVNINSSDSARDAWQRLINLGYIELEKPPEDPPEEGELFEKAIQEFQIDHSLDPTAELNEDTILAINNAHDQDGRAWKDRDWPEINLEEEELTQSKQEIT